MNMSFKQKRNENKLKKAYNAASGVIAGLSNLRDESGSTFQFTVSEYDTSVQIRTNVPENPENGLDLERGKLGNVSITVKPDGLIAVYDGMKYSPGYTFGPKVGVNYPHAAVMGRDGDTAERAVKYVRNRAKKNNLAL